MWQKVKVTLKFENKLCGSVPIDPNMIEPWLAARMPASKPNGARSMNDLRAEVMTTTMVEEENREIADRITLGFQKMDGGLVMRGGTVKAHLKDCSRIVTSMIVGKVKGERTLSQRVVNCINVEEYWIPLSKNGEPITEADNVFEKAVHVMTMLGPRNALKRILFVEKPEMTFHLAVALTKDDEPVVSLDELTKVFEYGEGRYQFTIN